MFIINSDGVLVYNGAIEDIRSAEIEDIPKAKNYVKIALDEVGKKKSVHSDKRTLWMLSEV